VEELALNRRQKRIKMPDAIILAMAEVAGDAECEGFSGWDSWSAGSLSGLRFAFCANGPLMRRECMNGGTLCIALCGMVAFLSYEAGNHGPSRF
jgi:hypothetical protein